MTGFLYYGSHSHSRDFTIARATWTLGANIRANDDCDRQQEQSHRRVHHRQCPVKFRWRRHRQLREYKLTENKASKLLLSAGQLIIAEQPPATCSCSFEADVEALRLSARESACLRHSVQALALIVRGS